MLPNSSKIALMIDADNISSKAFLSILTKAKSRGKILSIFASGKENSLSGWANIVEEYRLRIITAFVGKDVADRIIVKECADISLERPEIDTFCIVSNDAGFAPICHLLRSWGKSVFVIGTAQAAKSLQSDFEFMPLEPSTSVSSKTKQLMSLLEAAFAKLKKDNAWVNLSQLKTQVQLEDENFQSKDYGSAKFLKILQTLPSSFIELKQVNKTASARLKNPNTKNE